MKLLFLQGCWGLLWIWASLNGGVCYIAMVLKEGVMQLEFFKVCSNFCFLGISCVWLKCGLFKMIEMVSWLWKWKLLLSFLCVSRTRKKIYILIECASGYYWKNCWGSFLVVDFTLKKMSIFFIMCMRVKNFYSFLFRKLRGRRGYFVMVNWESSLLLSATTI